MRIRHITKLDDLAPYADDWERLAAGVPFRSWTWLSRWWRFYGPQTDSDTRHTRLAVLGAFDDAGALMGVAPWYIEHSSLHGRVLRPLGTGEVCSDYLSVLCEPAAEETILEALANYLVANAHDNHPDALLWDLLKLGNVEAADRTVARLVNYLALADCTVHRRPNVNCWRLKLPTTWDEYVASLGKNFRRDVRRLERELLDTDRAVLRSAAGLDDLPRAMDILVELHQRRRATLGEPGCFASPRFHGFFRDVVPALMRQGQLEFHWLELDGQPIAAEYQLVGNGVLYAYQAGVDPDAMEHQPGKLLNLAILRRAIEENYQEFDFLRGDEPYKARFLAQPRPTVEIRVVPRRAVAQVRHNLWLAGSRFKKWVKRKNSGQRPTQQ